MTVATDRVVGVVSYATRPGDEAGLILWLHNRSENRHEEDQTVTEALVTHALAELGPRPVHAFEFASALTLGLEGLPVRYRPVTRKALEAAGFSGRDLWRYIHRRLDAPLPRQVSPLAEVSPSMDPAGWLGRALLGQCLTHLTANGAREVIAYVDDDAPAGDIQRDHSAANHLYDQAGFAEVDRLHSFLRRP